MEEIYARMPEGVIGVEITGRYDGIAYYLDEKTGQRYSRNGYPIEKDEVCRPGEVCKVEFYDERGAEYKILSTRPDTDGQGGTS